MKKESKNLGLRKSCKVCKKTVIVDINLKGGMIEGSFGVKCHHCYVNGVDTVVIFELVSETTLKIKEVKSKPRVTKSAIVAIVILLIGFSVYFAIAKNSILVKIPYEETNTR